MRVKREMDIMGLLRRKGFAGIGDLSSLLSVSRNTVRRDLKSLQQQGAVRITHGGAVLSDNTPMGIPLGEREVQLREEKQRIGLFARQMVRDGDAVLLDAGTTTEQIAVQLKDYKGLTIITNAVNVLLALIDAPDVSVVSTGGVVNTVTHCFYGSHAEQFLAQFHVDVAFVSAGGLTTGGVTNTNIVEVQIKRTMLQIAARTVLVVTHDKIGKTSLAPFAQLHEIDVILTDDKADPALLEELRGYGPEIIVC